MHIWHIFKKFVFWAAIGLVFMAALIVVLHWQTNVVSNGIKDYLQHSLKGKVQVEYSSLSGSLINSIKIKRLNVVTPSGLKFSVNYFELHYRLLPLLKNKIEISKVVVDHLQIELRAGAKNKEAGKPFSIDSLLAELQTHYLPKQLLGNLPSIDLGKLEIISSSISVKNQPFTFTQVYLDLARLRLKPDFVFLALTNFSAYWKEQNLNLKTLSFVLQGDQNGITLNQGELRSSKSSVLFNVLLQPNSGLNLNLTQFYLDLGEIANKTKVQFFKEGYLKGTLSVSGVPVRFGLQGNLEGKIDERTVSAFNFLLRYDRGELFLDHWEIASNCGNLKAHGYWNKKKRIIGKAKFKAVNLGLITPSLPSTFLNGDLRLNASNLILKRLTGFGALYFYRSIIDTVKIDSVQINIAAKNGYLNFKEPSFIKITDSAKVYLTGTMDQRRNIDFSLLTFNNSLPLFLRDFGGRALKGKFDGRIRLFGPLKNPNFSGNLFMPRLHYSNVRLDTVKFNLFVEGIAKERRGRGEFKILSGKLGNFPLDRVSFVMETGKNAVTIKKLRFISGENYFNTSLQIHWSLDSLSVKAFPFKIQYQNYWISAKDTLIATVNSKEAVLEDWNLAGPDSSGLVIDGFYDMNIADFQIFVTLHHIKIVPFDRMLNTNLHLGGNLNGYAEILTPLSDPNVEVDLQVDSLKAKNILLGHFVSKFRFAHRSLSVDTLCLDDGNSDIQAKGAFALNVEKKKINLLSETKTNFSLQWNRFNLGHYVSLFKGIHRLQGRTSGKIRINGIVNSPEIHSKVSLDDFHLEDFGGDSLLAKIHYKDGYIRLDHFSIVLDSSHFKAQGWQKYKLSLAKMQDNILKEPFELHVWSNDDQLLFLGNLNDIVESLQGPYHIDVTLGGTPEKPSIKKGNIKLKNGQMLLSMIRDPLKNVQFDADIKNSVLQIKKFVAYSVQEKDFWQKAWTFVNSLWPWNKHTLKEGSLTASGSVDLSDLSRPKINLKAKLDKFYIDYFIQNISLIASSDNLEIQGQDTIYVQGDLYIPKGVFEVDLGQLSRNVYLSQETVKPIPPYLSLNLRVEIPGNFTVTSSPLDLANNFHVMFLGDLQVSMQPPSEQPRIQGHLEATNGKYSSWNQNFVVESATIDFKNNPTINPDINFTAFKIIGNRTFELSVTGNLQHLNQHIRLLENGQEVNISYFDKIALLTLGADISTLQSNVDSTLRNVGENIATTSILTAVERGAERFTGLDKVEITSNKSLLDLNRFRLNNGLSDASIAFGKYLTSDLYVEYRTQFGSHIPAPRLSWDAGNRLGLQYRINRFWSLDSYYEVTQRGNTRINFGLNWEYSF